MCEGIPKGQLRCKECGAMQVGIEIDGRIRDVDECIGGLVASLNNEGFKTVASCCGHGNRPGNIALADGRELIIARNFDEGRAVDDAFPDIHGNPPRLTARLLRYGGHTDHCTTHTKGECDCDWEDIKGEIQRATA